MLVLSLEPVNEKLLIVAVEYVNMCVFCYIHCIKKQHLNLLMFIFVVFFRVPGYGLPTQKLFGEELNYWKITKDRDRSKFGMKMAR